MIPVDVSPALPRLRKATEHVLTMRESTDQLVAECRGQRLGQIPWRPLPTLMPGRTRPPYSALDFND
ncbi:MAG: hypothetical protein ACLPZR_05785 [Solirubrobacteraceae bacterium]|jgi:hypothetical protein